MRITRNLILSFLLSALLVGCSTSLKPLKFLHGQPDTNVPALFQSSIPPMRFHEGKPITNAPLILRSEQKKGAELLISPTWPKTPAHVIVAPPVKKPATQKWSLGYLAVYYVVMGLLVFFAYRWVTKSRVKHPKPQPPAAP